MAIDPKYQDNLIFKKDAYQNLLTNIKNYPIIDIDYMTESDVDERYNDTVWQNYTDGMPCIKITYGDETTTKGNIIFKEENRAKIAAANKQIKRLTEIKNEYLKLRERWQTIFNENSKLIDEKRAILQNYADRIETADQDKYDFLIQAFGLLYKWNPSNTSKSVPLIEMTDNSEYGSFHEDFPDIFDYQVIQMVSNNEIVSHSHPNETVPLRIGLSFLKNSQVISSLLTTIQLLKQGCITNEVFAAESNEAAVFDSFKEFIQYYNTLVFLDGIKEQATIPEHYNFLEKLSERTTEYTSNKYYIIDEENSDESNPIYIEFPYTDKNTPEWIAANNADKLYVFKGNPPESIQELLIYERYNPQYDFQNVYNSFRDYYNTIVQDIIAKINANLDTVNNKLRSINQIINWLDGAGLEWEPRKSYQQIANDSIYNSDITYYTYSNNNYEEYIYDEENWEADVSDGLFIVIDINYDSTHYTAPDHYSKTMFEGSTNESIEEISIGDYQNLIDLLNEQMLNAASTHMGSDHTLYGYKYVKVGSNIQFDKNFDTVQEKEDDNINQASGTFRITINGHTYEIPIKGFGKPSNAEINMRTTSNINIRANDVRYIQIDPDSTYDENQTYYQKDNEGKYNPYEYNVNTWDSDKSDLYIREGGSSTLKLYSSGDITLDSSDGQIIIGKDLLPGSDPTLENIGAENQRWGTIYATNGNFSNDVAIGGNTTISGNLLPDNTDGNTENIGAQNNPWGAGYFNQITIGSGNDAFTLGGNNSSGSGAESPQFLGKSGWTNTLSGVLKITSAAGYTGASEKPDNTNYKENAIQCSGGAYFAKNVSALRVYNAVFNDYAEYRTTIDAEAGRIVVDNDDGSLSLSLKRLQPGAQVISDTFGHAMGATNKCQTPLAVAGRALVYTYKDRNEYHAGMAVCSAPNGTVDIMTREEIREYPDCIIGIVSEIPDYEVWGSDNVKVNGRIWIKVK